MRPESGEASLANHMTEEQLVLYYDE